MKKRLIGILLCIVMVASVLTACGTKETGGKGGDKTIGVCMPRHYSVEPDGGDGKG